jgi:hypothetical protein
MGIAPSEFWKMSPVYFWLEYDAMFGKQQQQDKTDWDDLEKFCEEIGVL